MNILDKMDIMVIAGYDVLANAISVHQEYVGASFGRANRENVDLILVVGGATNPGYPALTEAEANEIILKELLRRFTPNAMNPKIPVMPLPVGNTSAETLEVVKEFLEAQEIFVEKLILCVEQSRLAGFLLDALYVGLLDISEQIVAYGHRFPDSKKDFISQRKKMLMKVMSHYGFPFSIIRSAYQWFHQRRVARIKRRAPRF